MAEEEEKGSLYATGMEMVTEILATPKMDIFRSLYNTFTDQELEAGENNDSSSDDEEENKQSKQSDLNINMTPTQSCIVKKLDGGNWDSELEQLFRAELKRAAIKSSRGQNYEFNPSLNPWNLPKFISNIPTKREYVSELLLKRQYSKRITEINGNILSIPLIELLKGLPKFRHLGKNTLVNGLYISIQSYYSNRIGSVQIYTTRDSLRVGEYANMVAIKYMAPMNLFLFSSKNKNIFTPLMGVKNFEITRKWLQHAPEKWGDFYGKALVTSESTRIKKTLESVVVMSHMAHIDSQGKKRYDGIEEDTMYYVINDATFKDLQTDLSVLLLPVPLSEFSINIKPLCHDKWTDMITDPVIKVSEAQFKDPASDSDSDDDDEVEEDQENKKYKTLSEKMKANTNPVTIDSSDKTTDEYLTIHLEFVISFRFCPQ